VVFQAEDNATLLRFGQALFQAADDPAEPFVIGDTGQPVFDPLVLHQLVEVFGRAPASRVHANCGNSQRVGQLNAADRMVDVLLPFRRVKLYERLMRRETAQIQAAAKRLLLELL